MSQESQLQEMTKKPVLFHLPGMEAVSIRQGVVYHQDETGELGLDVYLPPAAQAGTRLPAVVFVMGYPDVGFQRIFGCITKEMESYKSWGRMVAASGMVAIMYQTGANPTADVNVLLRFVRENAAQLGVDENRIGIWACSGHVPNALAVLMQSGQDFLKCAALCYGVTLDLDGATAVAELSKAFGFVNPAAGKTVADLPSHLPLLVVRAGKDELPHLNEAMDRFLAHALRHNLPFTLINHAAGPHAFDLMHDSAITRETIRQVLAFLRFHLLERE
ncbi:MAG: alpha/beta hydrolase [Blastocatellia bacterium]|nr:alpha/beta hydrolase [Blastocatellia bacterium]